MLRLYIFTPEQWLPMASQYDRFRNVMFDAHGLMVIVLDPAWPMRRRLFGQSYTELDVNVSSSSYIRTYRDIAAICKSAGPDPQAWPRAIEERLPQLTPSDCCTLI